MDDRQLLEAAARAAGYPISEGHIEETPSGLWWVYIDSNEETHPPPTDSAWTELWNPLTDDGDALRLAVQCGLEVSFVNEDGIDRACVGYSGHDHISDHIAYVFEDHKGDIFAATRRAIVRAAASRAKGV